MVYGERGLKALLYGVDERTLDSLGKYMKSAEPMPFIVDDILVDFDDDHSQAALNTLAELAKKTQVILFTHHSQVVKQAKQLQGTMQVHEL